MLFVYCACKRTYILYSLLTFSLTYFHFFLVCYRWSVIFYSLVQFIHIPGDLLASAPEYLLIRDSVRITWQCKSTNVVVNAAKKTQKRDVNAHNATTFIPFFFHFHYYIICSHHTNFISSLAYIIVMYNFSSYGTKKSLANFIRRAREKRNWQLQ